jgi:hypothetical protein
MPEREDSRAPRAVKPPVSLESIASIARASVRVVPTRSLGAIELHVDGRPLLLLSDLAVAALIAALLGSVGGHRGRGPAMTRLALAALVVGVAAALLSAVVFDHRLGVIERWIAAAPAICAVPPAALARRQPTDFAPTCNLNAEPPGQRGLALAASKPKG